MRPQADALAKWLAEVEEYKSLGAQLRPAKCASCGFETEDKIACWPCPTCGGRGRRGVRMIAKMYDIGTQVEKFTGDYQLPGEVRDRFWTKAGKLRYVVEHYGGICHIYSDAQLRLFPPGKTVKWEWVEEGFLASLPKSE